MTEAWTTNLMKPPKLKVMVALSMITYPLSQDLTPIGAVVKFCSQQAYERKGLEKCRILILCCEAAKMVYLSMNNQRMADMCRTTAARYRKLETRLAGAAKPIRLPA